MEKLLPLLSESTGLELGYFIEAYLRIDVLGELNPYNIYAFGQFWGIASSPSRRLRRCVLKILRGGPPRPEGDAQRLVAGLLELQRRGESVARLERLVLKACQR